MGTLATERIRATRDAGAARGTDGDANGAAHSPHAATLYEDVAGRIAAMIDGGTYGPGDRLPSVRNLHAQFDVSVTTVLEAYRLLEDRGVIRARPQSGYFVRPRDVPRPRTAPRLKLPSTLGT